MPEALLLVLLLSLGLTLPALAIALAALSRAGRLERRVVELQRELEELTRRQKARSAEPATVPPTDVRVPPPTPEHAAPVPAPATQPSAAVPSRASAPAPAAKESGIERRIATRLPVWIGSMAIFLAGAYFVKWSFDRGLLGPAARVTMGILFAVALIVLGELLRKRARRIAEGLAAAGVADLYASLLAGVTLYQLIPRPLGFGLMAGTTALAVLLALRHGPLIAVLGLAGGFLTPVLIGSHEPNAPALFTYLFLLQAGLVAAARPRRWWPIAAATLGAGSIWAGIWIGFFFHPGDERAVGLFLLATSTLFSGAALWRGGEAWGVKNTGHGLLLSGLGAPLALLSWLAATARYTPMEWCFLGLLAAGCLVVGRLEKDNEPLPWLASAAGLLLLVSWWLRGPAPAPAALGWTALGYGGLIAAGAYAAMWGTRVPGRWAALSGGSAAAYFLVAWGALRGSVGRTSWSLASLALAAAFVAGAWPVARRRDRDAAAAPALAALAAAAAFFASAAVPLRFERWTWSVAWALEVPALAWIEGKLCTRVLRGLAWILGALVLVRLLLNPWAFVGPIGALPVLNWILYAWGIPLAAFALASWLYRRDAADGTADAFEGGAVLLALALLLLEVRHLFHPDRYADGAFVSSLTGRTAVAEWGLVVGLWLLLGWGLLELGARFPRRALLWGAPAVTALALAAGLAGLGGIDNPLFSPLEVGDFPILNALLVGFGLPAVLSVLVALALHRRGQIAVARFAAVGSLLFWLLLIVTEVRQAFHGRLLNEGPPQGAELYAYSAAFGLFGLLLLGLGIARRGLVLRWGSLAVMLLAAFKVFLWDLATLRDLYRVFSLLGLGASLLLLAWLYQRFVFADAD
jgi:uncharacterized membrane protein